MLGAARPLLAATLLFLSACDGPAAADGLSAPLFERHSLRPTGATVAAPVEIGDPGDIPWLLYQEASARIGLGDGWLAGTAGELRTTPVQGSIPGIRAHVLVVGGRVIGAWLSHPSEAPGIYPLSEPP
jgi:hypothetical protein